MKSGPALVLALLLLAPSARADDDALRRATAAYAEGMDLRVAGHPQASVERLRLAHQLYPTPITGLELGRGYAVLGKLLEAREVLASVARVGPRSGESARANTARAEAAALGLELAERIPRILFTHEGPAPAVTIDGSAVESVEVPARLNPGIHTVVWATQSRQVTLAERQVLSLDLTGQGPAPAPPPPPDPEPQGPSRALFWTGLALTGAAVAAGTVSGLVAMGDANTARPSCPGDQCAPPVHGAADAARTWSTVSTASFVTAGVLGVASVAVYLLTGSPHKEPPRVGSLSLSF